MVAYLAPSQKVQWVSKYLECTVVNTIQVSNQDKARIHCPLADTTGATKFELDPRSDVETETEDGIMLYALVLDLAKSLPVQKQQSIAAGMPAVDIPESVRKHVPPMPGTSVGLATALNSPSKRLKVRGKVVKVILFGI